MTGILDTPFFTLEYRREESCFLRKIPPDAEDLGAGRFRQEGKTMSLPGDGSAETKILEQPLIKGKDILALARRGYNPLIRSGPLMAEREDRLMELGLLGGLPVPGETRRRKAAPPEPREIEIILRYGKVPEEQWLPLEGLPNYRLYENRVYEIIPKEIQALFSRKKNRESLPASLRLRGAEIPAFADDHARLIYVFADQALYQLLAQDTVFVPPEKLSLVLRCAPLMERGVGKAIAVPCLKYENKRYSARVLSRYFHRKYLPLKDRWVRRETLDRAGIGPLGKFVNGESLEPFPLKPKDLLARGGESLRLLSLAEFPGSLEPDKERWVKYGREEEIFFGHLEFLRSWGISGGIIASPEKAAPFLAAWLVHLAKKTGSPRSGLNEEGPQFFSLPDEPRVLVLMPRAFWDRRLSRELPQSGEGPLRVPADRWPGADSIRDPAFRGIGLDFYGHHEDGPKLPWDILVAAGLDEVSGLETLLRELETLPCRLRLGIFFKAPGINGGPHSELIKSFFRVKGALKEYEKYLIRETGDLLSLPPPPASPFRSFLRPPCPWDRALLDSENFFVFGGGRFLAEAKFRSRPGKSLPVTGFRAEEEEFFRSGEKAPFVPIDGTIRYRHLSEKERDYFFYWRGEFRRGRAWEIAPGYIFIYARELILRMDALPAEKALEELYRLWERYGDIFPEALGDFPRWILDFAILHHTPPMLEGLSRVFAGFQNSASSSKDYSPEAHPFFWGSPLLLDLYLHRKYVEENHPLEWKDFISLLGRKYANLAADPGSLLAAEGDEALNRADRALRKNYGKKLLEFFYPVPPAAETFTCFEGLPDLGYSAFRAEWISFSRHKPFLKFLASLASFLEYRILKNSGSANRGNGPYLDPVWKYFCGFDERPPEELTGEKGAPDQNKVNLEEEKIRRLREESDAVMEMLKIEKDAPDFEDSDLPGEEGGPRVLGEREPLALSSPARQSMAGFVAGLDETALGCLELLSRGKGRELETFARQNNTMAELIIDEINGQFLLAQGDLLIEQSLDEGPKFQEEYKDEILWALTFRNV